MLVLHCVWEQFCFLQIIVECKSPTAVVLECSHCHVSQSTNQSPPFATRALVQPIGGRIGAMCFVCPKPSFLIKIHLFWSTNYSNKSYFLACKAPWRVTKIFFLKFFQSYFCFLCLSDTKTLFARDPLSGKGLWLFLVRDQTVAFRGTAQFLREPANRWLAYYLRRALLFILQ